MSYLETETVCDLKSSNADYCLLKLLNFESNLAKFIFSELRDYIFIVGKCLKVFLASKPLGGESPSSVSMAS